MTSNRNKTTVIVLLLLLTFGIISICSKNGNDIKVNGTLTIGIIDKVYGGTKGGLNIDYHFYFKGDTIRGSEFYYISSHYLNDFKIKASLLNMYRQNPQKNRILILKNDFEEMNEKFPDSLKWVLY